MYKRHLYTILFISWVVLITILSLFSFKGVDDGGFKIPYFDKLVHFTFYFGFVVLGYLFFKNNIKLKANTLKIILSLVFVAFLYGIVIEVLQDIMPYGRAAEILDVLANTMGAIFGGILANKYLSLT